MKMLDDSYFEHHSPMVVSTGNVVWHRAPSRKPVRAVALPRGVVQGDGKQFNLAKMSRNTTSAIDEVGYGRCFW
jgi:hypothetical protein